MRFLVADEGRVCFDDNAVGVAKGDNGALLAPGVKLFIRQSVQSMIGAF